MLNRKNKKLIIILGLALILVLIIVIVIVLKQRQSKSLVNTNNQSSSLRVNNLPPPDFLTKAEKEKLRVSPDLKIQSLRRNAKGQVMVYKIIKSPKDIVLDPTKISPFSSRKLLPAK